MAPRMVLESIFNVLVYPGLSTQQALFGSMQFAVTRVIVVLELEGYTRLLV